MEKFFALGGFAFYGRFILLCTELTRMIDIRCQFSHLKIYRVLAAHGRNKGP